MSHTHVFFCIHFGINQQFPFTPFLFAPHLMFQQVTLCSVLCLSSPTSFCILLPIERMKPVSCWKLVHLERTQQRVNLKWIMWPSCPIRTDINPSNKLPMNREGKSTIYFNDFTAGLTQYIHLKAKSEMQVIQERTCYESLTKKCICNKASQIAKLLHEAACFRFKSYMGPKFLNGPLMWNAKKTCHTFSCLIIFGQDVSIKFLLFLMCLVTFLKCWQFCKMDVLFMSWGMSGQK